MWATVTVILISVCYYYVYLLTGNFIVTTLMYALYMMYLPGNNWAIRNSRFFRYAREVHHRVEYKGPGVDLLQEKKRPYCFAMHPHGAHAVSAIVGLASNSAFPNIRIVASSVLFWLPIVKEFMGWGNCIPAHRKNIIDTLQSKSSVALYPAGLRETAKLFPEEQQGNDQYIFQRTSFIHIAKSLNVPIVPIWINGEYYTHDVHWPFLRLSQYLYRKIRYPWPMITLGWYWGPLPKPVQITFNVGTAIETTDRSVEELESLFYSQLRELQKV